MSKRLARTQVLVQWACAKISAAAGADDIEVKVILRRLAACTVSTTHHSFCSRRRHRRTPLSPSLRAALTFGMRRLLHMPW
jgi:hypothetical protein